MSGTVENAEYVAFMRRCMRALAKRCGSADVETFAEMVRLRDELDARIAEAVAELRHDDTAPASWAQIAHALGVSRQAAQQRWRALGGRRRPGGQPGPWR